MVSQQNGCMFGGGGGGGGGSLDTLTGKGCIVGGGGGGVCADTRLPLNY